MVIEYALRDFSCVKDLNGISDSLIQNHLKLYEGYVKNVNLLRRKLSELRPGVPEFSELQRRVGFEINGMRLHELYFENLQAGGSAPSDSVQSALKRQWGSYEDWWGEFAAIGAMRGVGWAILYKDPVTKNLSNHWIGLHEEGHPAGFVPLLVMDVWEHAFMGMERPKYIGAFSSNIDWRRVEARIRD